MRTHIAKALKSRSKAIRTAVDRYNAAAGRLVPPRAGLDIKTVLEYVFLGQFDLLRDSRFSVQEKPWTRAAEREAAVQFFKLRRSQEELVRLDVEVRRLAAYIADAEARIVQTIADLRATDAPLAHQLHKREVTFFLINLVHRARLNEIMLMRGLDDGFMVGSMLGEGVEAVDRNGDSDDNEGSGDETSEDAVAFDAAVAVVDSALHV